MNYLLGLTLVGVISGLFGGLVGGGAEIVIVPLLTLFGLLSNLKNRTKHHYLCYCLQLEYLQQ